MKSITVWLYACFDKSKLLCFCIVLAFQYTWLQRSLFIRPFCYILANFDIIFNQFIKFSNIYPNEKISYIAYDIYHYNIWVLKVLFCVNKYIFHPYFTFLPTAIVGVLFHSLQGWQTWLIFWIFILWHIL